MSENKVNCKYWDKCYQKNEAHLSKYNHPPKEGAKNTTDSKAFSPNTSAKSPGREKRRITRSHSPEKMQHLRSRSRSPIKTVLKNEGRKSLSPNSSSKFSGKEKRSKSKSPIENDEHNHSKRSRSKSPIRSFLKTEDSSKELSETNEKIESSEKSEDIHHEEKHYVRIFHNTVHNSKKDEYIELLKTTDFIRHKFLVEMPDDFYEFWAFCSSLAKVDHKPEQVFKNFGLELVGPFEYLAGAFNNADIKEPGDYLRHWRFYYDPPEFQTIFVKKRSGVHYGYWRDDPSEKSNLLLARNDCNKGCEFNFVATNCFQALLYFIEHDFTATPFNTNEVKKIKDSLKKFSENHNINLKNFEEIKCERDKKVVTKTFHKAGLVVPYDRKTQMGYRPLMETDSNLKKIINKLADAQGNKEIIASAMESLQPIITAANIAVDECDFGTTLELGIDLFCSGHKEFHELIVSLLVPGYSMLKRPQFIAIVKAHLEYRRKGNSLSLFETE